MKSILVPTDFSPASYNAAHYAIALADQLKSSEIILLNTYMQLISDDPATTNFISIDTDELRNISEQGLKNFREKLSEQNTANIELKTVSDFNTIENGIKEISEKYNTEIIVMSISEAADKLDEFLLGSNALEVARESHVPVIIVPAKAKFTALKRILFACDLKKVMQTTPVTPIKKILDETKAELLVLHVEANANDFSGNLTAETLVLDDLLGSYNPKYNFATDKHFTEAVDNFAMENNIDLIITIPKKHGFFDGLFKRSHTKELAFHSHIPLMAIHE